jgi:hypothetical protein
LDSTVAGPNTVTAATTTNLTGILAGAGGVVGSLTDPLPIANGGTGVATKVLAQAALGLGVTPTQGLLSSPVDISAYSTATALANGAAITIPTAGVYLLLMAATVSGAAATLTTQICTLALRNGAVAISGAFQAQTKPVTTTTGTLAEFTVMGFGTYAASDVINVYATLSAAPGAGTVSVAAVTMIAIPLALS